jgi:hypothetical protein
VVDAFSMCMRASKFCVDVMVVATQQPAYGVAYGGETKPVSSSGSVSGSSSVVVAAAPGKSAYGSSSQSSDLSDASLRQREEMLAQREAVLAQREESLKLKCVHSFIPTSPQCCPLSCY